MLDSGLILQTAENEGYGEESLTWRRELTSSASASQQIDSVWPSTLLKVSLILNPIASRPSVARGECVRVLKWTLHSSLYS